MSGLNDESDVNTLASLGQGHASCSLSAKLSLASAKTAIL